jgi:hypothetical protein
MLYRVCGQLAAKLLPVHKVWWIPLADGKMVLRIDISGVLIALASMVHNYERSWFLFQAIWHSTQILSEHETQ